MADNAPFRRIAVLGTGLIGGSFALAVRKHFPTTELTGWDRDPAALERARARGAIDDAPSDLASAARGADLVYLALPVGAIVKALPAVAAAADPSALVTDTGSTREPIERAARGIFRGGARFLGGHPMAGKESSGIDHADGDLFRGAPYALIASESDADPRVGRFAALVEAIGAHGVWCDAPMHDWAVGFVSHLPQLASVALARVILDECDDDGFPLALAGQGLQDTLRLAGSPYSVWRDILAGNRENAGRALGRLIQALEHLQRNLESNDLEEEFRAANELYKKVRKT